MTIAVRRASPCHIVMVCILVLVIINSGIIILMISSLFVYFIVVARRERCFKPPSLVYILNQRLTLLLKLTACDEFLLGIFSFQFRFLRTQESDQRR